MLTNVLFKTRSLPCENSIPKKGNRIHSKKEEYDSK